MPVPRTGLATVTATGVTAMETSRTVQQVLQKKGGRAWTIAPGASVFEALQLMAEKNVGALVVTEGAEVVGVFSERDYARKIILVGKSSKETSVADIMTTLVISVSPRQTLDECMKLMTEERVRHLPVLDDGELVGVVSIGDAVKEIITEQAHIIEQLQNYVSGGSY